MIFHSRPFPGKTNEKIFLKNQKNLFLGILGFLPKYGQMEIFRKNWALCGFRYSNYLKTCQKLQKN